MKNKVLSISLIFLLEWVNSIVSASSKNFYTLAFDVETSGSSFIKNGILSIGASLQDQDSQEIKQFQVNLHLPPNRGYDNKCLEEFWHKHSEAHAFVQSNSLPPQEGIKKFCAFLDDIEHHHHPLYLVSDNPSFDVSWLNLYIDTYTDKKSLNYDQEGKYRLIWDVQSMQRMALIMKTKDIKSQWDLSKKLGLESRWTPDHNPLNDARTIADNYNQTIKLMYKDESCLKINQSTAQLFFYKIKRFTSNHSRKIPFLNSLIKSLNFIKKL